MKKNDALKDAFNEAVAFMNTYTEPLPADILLKIYAYYKIATENYSNPGSSKPLINAFKMNALIQAQDMSIKKASKLYIETVNIIKKGGF